MPGGLAPAWLLLGWLLWGLAGALAAAAGGPGRTSLGLVGDSISAGNVAPGGSGGTPYAQLLAESLAEDFEVTNHAVGGTTLADWAPGGELFAGVPAHGVVVVQLGSNDAVFGAMRADAYQAKMRALAEALLARGVGDVIVVPPPPHPGHFEPGNRLNRRLARYGQLLRPLCREPHIHCGPDLYADLTPVERYFADPGRGLDSDPHPNAAGHRRIAERLAPVVREVARSSPEAPDRGGR